jgi:hypothetical protein
MDVSEQTGEVFKSVRADVDPVSGNEVPPGALPEEVRDDIDAKLSEGEYVVPADVLRYYGLKFFEDLRNKAKTKMEELDGDGRIGGEPVMEEGPEDEELPFDIRELRVRQEPDMESQMAEGGLVSSYAEGGDVTKMDTPDFLTGVTAPSAAATSEFKKYVNAEGQELQIRFVGGKPMSPIPAGYTEGTATTEASEDSTVALEEGEAFDIAAQEKADQERAEEMRGRFKDMSSKELMEQLSKSQKMSKVGKGLGAAVPFGSMLAGLAGRAEGFAIARAAKEGFMNAKTQAEKDAFASVHEAATTRGREEGEGIFGGGGLFGGGGTLNDVNNDGKSNFGDTYTGDLLGFDGKVGVQGPNARDSWNGTRREGGTGTRSNELGETKSYDTGEGISANDYYDFGPDVTKGWE